ncbi:MAG TPA: universal stress protein [Longimicrobiales bacterium]
MPRQIMVPLDGSPFSEQALAYAMDVAAGADTRVHLARVHTEVVDIGLASFAAPLPLAWNGMLDEELRKQEQEYLRERAAPWIAAGRDVCIANPSGPAAAGLAAYADAADIDLIVMTSHGRGGLSRAWLGSVADRLVRSTGVPVLLLRPLAHAAPTAAPAHILVPLDGSELSESILDHAIRIGAPVDARYTLMQVVLPPIDATAEVIAQGLVETDELRAAAESYLDAWAARLRARGLTVDTAVVIQANPAAGIIEEALYSECDMIAMATHGRSGWERAVIGSVADKVLRSTPVPMLTMRPAVVGAAA